jgi:drug/metabolite transporter (DMT)-like permease
MLQIVLLLILGFNGAIYLVLGDLMAARGYHGFISAALHAGGSALSLAIACGVAGLRPTWSKGSLKYYAICAIFGLIGPAVSTFWVIPHIGTGLMAAVIATSPLFTTIFAHVFGVERINLLLVLGIVIGFVGTAIIILGEVSWPTSDDRYVWLIASLIVPTLLAAGNVARTALWPGTLRPIQAGSGISAVAFVFAIILVPLYEPDALTRVPPTDVAVLIAAFIVLNGINAFPFFYLQRIGGPTILSLLSHVMAGFGLLLGWMFLGESYRPADLIGVALILIGVSTTSFIKRIATCAAAEATEPKLA